MSRGLGHLRNLGIRPGHFAAIMLWGLVSLLLAFPTGAARAGTFRVASYNLENYLDQPTATRPRVKSPEARAKIRESIRAADPDVLAVEEMGTTNALLELRDSLKHDGIDLPYWEHVQAFDTNIHVAVLSRLPILARRPHTNDSFLLDGRRFQVKRGFAELDFQAGTNFTFTLMVAHLKSQLATPDADESEERLAEARVLRRLIDARLAREPAARLIVLGDFNSTFDSASTREIIGRGRTRLLDARPAGRDGVWTYFYGKSDTYSRIDFILFSPALKQNWLAGETSIPEILDWNVGSDHRLIVAGFTTEAN